MKHLRRFARLRTSEQWLLIKAALLLEAFKLSIHLLPFRVLRSLADGAERIPVRVRHADQFSAESIGWVVETMSRHMPGEKTCLTQALTTQVLLSRRGHPALLHIGVVKKELGEFQAHAWVECEGKIVIGGHELERYTLLTTLEKSRAQTS